MTENLEKAIAFTKALPPELQDDVADAMMMAGGGEVQGVYYLTDEDRAAVAASRAQVARGEFVTDEQLQAHRAKYRL